MRSRSFLAVLVCSSSLFAQYTGFWEDRPSLAIARQEVGAAVLGGLVYVTGGLNARRSGIASVEVFDPKTQRWSRIADMPMSLHHHGTCAVGGKLYAIGGYSGATFTPTARCFSWDPKTKRWTRIADLPRPRGALVAVAIGSKIYAIGGVARLPAATTVVATLTEYDPATNTWTTRASMPTAREHLAATTIGGKLYVAGGRNRGVLKNQLEMYDPASKLWKKLTAMPTARGGTGASVLDGKLIVVGGEASRNFPEAEEYDPQTDKWRRLRDMSLPLHGIYPVTIGNDLIVAGGGTRPGFAATNRVIALRRLPTGVNRYGRSTKACNGEMFTFVTEAPKAGAQNFTVVNSPNAPPRTGGLFLLGGKQDLLGTAILCIRLHIGLLPPLILLPVTADASGESRIRLAIPTGTRGARVFSQFVWANTQTCRGSGPLSASDALRITIQ